MLQEFGRPWITRKQLFASYEISTAHTNICVSWSLTWSDHLNLFITCTRNCISHPNIESHLIWSHLTIVIERWHHNIVHFCILSSSVRLPSTHSCVDQTKIVTHVWLFCSGHQIIILRNPYSGSQIQGSQIGISMFLFEQYLLVPLSKIFCLCTPLSR